MDSGIDPTTSNTIRLKITGMTCGHCVHAVTEALNEVPGVAAAKVTLQPGLAEVEGKANPTALIAAIEEAGYQAKIVSAGEV